MDTHLEQKVWHYLRDRLGFSPLDCDTVQHHIKKVARAGGYAVDHRFADAGLGSGPEARVASGIVKYAMGGGGISLCDHELKRTVEYWLRTTVAGTR